GSETLTLTTYYPAPYGGYVSLLTTGQTVLARDSGSVGIGVANPSGKLQVSGGDAIFYGNVGIGTAIPGAALHVVGSVKIEDGREADGKVLISDAKGKADWKALSTVVLKETWEAAKSATKQRVASKPGDVYGGRGKVSCDKGCLRTGCNATCRGQWSATSGGGSDVRPIDGEEACKIGDNDVCEGSEPDVYLYITCLCID
ncbi:MAG: hypothetical protein AAB359_01825, partial [Elusimicrobiota bacterium]